jgi:hypothetical protein
VASCPLHGGVYDILFDREGESVVKTAERPEDGKTCQVHPSQAAVADCTACGKTLCGICSFDHAGRHYCSDCAVNGVRAELPSPSAPALPPAAPIEPSARRRSAVPLGMKCAQHVEVDAVEQCRGCGNGVCETCNFEMPGGLHFCPACVDNAGSEEISPKRKKLVIAAIALAAYCTFMYFFMITGALYRAFGKPTDLQTFGCAVMLLIYAPSILGTAFAATARDRRLRNTTMIWIALVWNLVILVVLGIQFLVGMFS